MGSRRNMCLMALPNLSTATAPDRLQLPPRDAEQSRGLPQGTAEAAVVRSSPDGFAGMALAQKPKARHRFRSRRNTSLMAATQLSKATDADLLRLTTEDARAFGVFYDRFEHDVLAFFWRRTGRADLAADLTAEVFATALESVAQFDPERGPARAWLFGIARHELADTWERGRIENRARERLRIEPLVVSDEAIECIERLAAADSGVLGFLDLLPEDQRLAVRGRVLDESDYVELARDLACSPSVARQRVSRGLQALRERLGKTPQHLRETP